MIFLAREGDGTRQRPQPPRLTVWITFSSDRERERERESAASWRGIIQSLESRGRQTSSEDISVLRVQML